MADLVADTVLTVAVAAPAHAGLGDGLLSYSHPEPLPPGTLVRVPLGAREVLGVVWDGAPPPLADGAVLRPVAAVLQALAPLDAGWRRLIGFAARYYQRALGELALAALPPALRELDAVQLHRRLQRQARRAAETASAATAHATEAAPPPPTPEQAAALAAIDAAPAGTTLLLHGATGSGKTEVYLRAAAAALARDAQAQVLVLVPEINLTPQLEARFAQRFGAARVVTLHSGMTGPQRLQSWLAAHGGAARIVLGTRMAVLAALPRLALIVVDEEHDASYKQQEGARYSARDLAVWRGHDGGARVILGSATPSLESWWASRPAHAGAHGAEADAGGRYRRLAMPTRIGASALPRLRCVDMTRQPRGTVLAPALVAAVGERVARGQQALLLLNRRGYAPVLHCADCDWKSDCPHCSAYRVFHRIDRSLRCHHCGLAQPVPRACPQCGSLDLQPIGRGTERLQEQIGELLAELRRPDGGAVRIARIDADTTRARGALEGQLAQVHAGQVDVLVGTQMLAKGHDFRRVGLVAAVAPDAALFSSDFRAPERLAALLMQAAGRAGRDAALGGDAEMWLQTHHPTHPLYAALAAHDWPGFAQAQLAERRAAALPPFGALALLRADARTQALAQAFLTAAQAAAQAAADAGQAPFARLRGHVVCYPAVPLPVARVANVERAQMLIESPSRAALQAFLHAWQPLLHATRAQPAHKGLLRWLIDVDPLAI